MKRKMKIFQFVQKKFLFIYKIGLHERPFNSNILTAFLLFFMGIISNCVYFFYEVKTFQDYAYSVYFCTSVSGSAMIFTYVAFNMRKFFDCIHVVEKIVGGSKFHQTHNWYKQIDAKTFFLFSGLKCPVSKSIYRKCHRSAEKVSKIINIVAFSIIYQMTLIPILIANYYAYFTMNSEDGFGWSLVFPYWYDPFNFALKWLSMWMFLCLAIIIFRFPFAWQNPAGFLIAFSMMYIIQLNLMFFATFCLSYGICFYMWTMALTEDVRCDFIAFSNQIKSEPNPMMLRKKLIDLIKFGSAVKR